MKGEDRLQKLLYMIMAVLAFYIIIKLGEILLANGTVQSVLEEGSLQRSVEDAAMRTYAPGYTAAVEEREADNWIAAWLKPAAPVFSYLAEEDEKNTEFLSEEDGEYGAEDGMVGDNSLDTGARRADETMENISAGSERVEKGADTEQEEGRTEKDADTEQEEEKAGKSEATAQEADKTVGTGRKMDDVTEESLEAVSGRISQSVKEQIADFDYLLSNYYIVDEGTSVDSLLLDGKQLLGEDLSLALNREVPQILIYHTHSQETFVDSRDSEPEDSIVGMGEVLACHLREKYGYQVIHDTGVYDLVDGVLDRSAAYDYAREAVETILEEYPTIEVIIDLHRDGVDGRKFVTEIGGKPCSMIMFFNGISRNEQAEALSWLPNPYIKENLAFSLQLELLAKELYPGFTRNIYLKAERFNLHLRPRSLLIEAGTQLNTVEEERNAMEPLADLLHQVLTGKK